MFKKVLVLSPHTDDGELGCGGTIAKLRRLGADITYIAFSYAGNKLLKEETAKSMEILGISNFEILNFEKRYFYLHRQEILNFIYKYNEDFPTDLVFVPSSTDIHQDHAVITNEALRAFKQSTILGYEMAWNNIVFRSNCFFALEDEDVNKKLEALRCYKTQAKRNYFDEGFIVGVLRTRGVHIKKKYAEAFEVLKLVL